jgi:hypothetical protein
VGASDKEMAPRVLPTPRDPAHRRLSAVDTPSVAAGDPIAHAAQKQAQDELLEAAEAALDWLYSRRAHMPEEMLDGREAKHRKALREAIRKVREA